MKKIFLAFVLLGLVSCPGIAQDISDSVPTIRDYYPKSMLKVAESELGKAKFPVIDVHTHFGMRLKGDAAALDAFVKTMDSHNIALCVSLDAKLGEIETHLEFLKRYQDRFLVFTYIDFQGAGTDVNPATWDCNQPGFVRTVCEQLKKAKQKGVCGVKFFKQFGLGYRNADGSLIEIDDKRWDPIWEACAQLDLPILIHTGDPAAFFEPITVENERYEELARNPNWSFFGKDFPTRESLLLARNNVVERHPDTTFIGAHVAGNAEDLATVAKWLEAYPNLYVEFASRIGELGRQPYTARKFLIKYQDRVLFGTDGPWPELRLTYYWRFLETEDENFPYSEKRPQPQGLWHINAVNLPDSVLRKIYYKNAIKVIAPAASKYDSAKQLPSQDFFSRIRLEEPIVTNDAVIFGILMLMLGAIFWTSSKKQGPWARFYKYVPMLLLCYFLPAIPTAFHFYDPEESKLYYMASRFLLPASLVLLTLSIDLREILKLGPHALIMFFTGTVGVVLGGPIAVLIMSYVNPEVIGGVSPPEVWKGLSTVAGSWIGGGANQAAMKEIFMPDVIGDPELNQRSSELYSAMVAVDVLVAEFWMMFLLLGVGKAKAIDRIFNADASAVETLKNKMEKFSISTARIASTKDLMVVLAIAFGAIAVSHYAADMIAPWIGKNIPYLNQLSLNSKFFWLIVLATTIGVALSFTRFRNFEGAGASKIGTVCIFILVATIGMKMDIAAIVKYPGYFVVGLIWMVFHVGLMFIVGYLIKAPYFFLAVGSKANIGGAASAPVVAAAFHPALAPVGVLLAVLGYALGTYGALVCAYLMKLAS